MKKKKKKKRNQPPVTAIIPVYNEEKYLGRCLSSLLKQTYQPLEIIVVDDGSTDDSLNVISRFQMTNSKFQINFKHQAPNFKLFKQKHQGPGKARNLGASKAKGKILVFPDADMWFDKDYVKNLVKPILENKATATWTREEYVANPDNVWSKCWSIDHQIAFNRRIAKGVPSRFHHHRAILKKEFEKVGGYSDRDFGGKGQDGSVLAKLGKKSLVAKGAVCYHFNPSSIKEVFLDAQWYGRSKLFGRSLRGLLWISLPNSLRAGFLQAWKHKMPVFVFYKIIHDFGVAVGFIKRLFSQSRAK